MCVGIFSITAHAEQIDNFDLSMNFKLVNTAFGFTHINESFSHNNYDKFMHSWDASSIPINWGTKATLTTTVGREDGSLIAKKGETFNFRINNIALYFEMYDSTGYCEIFDWNSAEKTGSSIALIHTDGTWSYPDVNIDWNYTSGNETHSISVDITTDKDVRKIQYVEDIQVAHLLSDYWFNTHADNVTVFGDSNNSFSVLVDVESQETGVLKGILGKLGDGFSALGDKLTNVFNSIVELPQKLWNLISDGLKSLFVPSEESMTAYKDKWDELLSSRLGPVYQVCDIVTNSWSAIGEADTTDTIYFPSATINLPQDAQFTFGGYDVKIVPEGFDVLIQAIKLIVGIVCTLAFINGMLKRYDEIMGVEQ